jgi:uncharacterized protein (DUF58 family)
MDTGVGQRPVRFSLTGRIARFWQRRQARWLAMRVPAVASLQLGRRSIFILPTLHGALIGISALAISLIALAERNVVGVLLATLILSLFLLCLILAYRNLSGLHLKSVSNRPSNLLYSCFAGEQALFVVQIDAASPRRRHHQLSLGFEALQPRAIAVIAGAGNVIELQYPAVKRGLMSAPRLSAGSDYPLGLWRAWSRPDLSMQCLVYPQPLACKLPAGLYRRQGQQSAIANSAAQRGNDDFEGLREYRQGDAMRQIHWQSLARGHGLQSKVFVRENEAAIVLDWEMFRGRSHEEILSCLCYQVLYWSRQQAPVGLRLPGQLITPDTGDRHKHRLLSALALFPFEQPVPEAAQR